MGLSHSTRLLGDGAKELSHLPALQQGGNLGQAERARVWYQQYLLQPDTAHISPEAVHHIPAVTAKLLGRLHKSPSAQKGTWNYWV